MLVWLVNSTTSVAAGWMEIASRPPGWLVERQVFLRVTFSTCVAVTVAIGAESWDVAKFDMKPITRVGNGGRRPAATENYLI